MVLYAGHRRCGLSVLLLPSTVIFQLSKHVKEAAFCKLRTNQGSEAAAISSQIHPPPFASRPSFRERSL